MSDYSELAEGVMNHTASTSNSASTINLTGGIVYVADAELLRLIHRVLRKAATWKRQCCGKKTGKKFCESYGCGSLDELLAPLKTIKSK